MNVMIVTPKPLSGPRHVVLGDCDVWLRSDLSGLMSLPVDILVFAPDCTDEQRQLAMQKIQATNGVAYELREIDNGRLKTVDAKTDEYRRLNGLPSWSGFLADVRDGLIAEGLIK